MNDTVKVKALIQRWQIEDEAGGLPDDLPGEYYCIKEMLGLPDEATVQVEQPAPENPDALFYRPDREELLSRLTLGPKDADVADALYRRFGFRPESFTWGEADDWGEAEAAE